MKYNRLPNCLFGNKQVEIKGMAFDATGVFCHLLDELESCDGYLVTIYDDELAKKLVKLGVVRRSVKESYSYSPKNKAKLKKLKDIICEVAYE